MFQGGGFLGRQLEQAGAGGSDGEPPARCVFDFYGTCSFHYYTFAQSKWFFAQFTLCFAQ
ncbi:hypothetical protein AWM68_13070 [Fictibacillus phosphorivorans]|uniref:Uncharacterized protein n=1 Tax=Fictibacillus phosphorivorans TaxID=1221500 RepID=A0A165MZE5_9BACL|nr:hypothetical protein AWM68_13070 [Fictibacillus phosphorivorans]